MLSVLILTKNEEDQIGDCIKSIKDFADEIIVVDSYSVDKTVEVAEKLGVKVVKNKFIDFSNQRNFALRQVFDSEVFDRESQTESVAQIFDSEITQIRGTRGAQGNWVLYLDADERATDEFKSEVRYVIEHFDEHSGIGGYFMVRKTFFYGKDWGYSDKVQRLFYKKFLKGWEGELHETPQIVGTFGLIESPILHYTHRDLSQMVEKTNEWSEVEAQLRYRAHHPKMSVLRFFRVMFTGFLKSYILEKGYKNGTEGLIESMYQAFSMFITYAKLWEKQIGGGKKEKK